MPEHLVLRWRGGHGVVAAERRLVAILVADIVGYSRLMEADEAGTLAAIKALRADVIDPLLSQHHGRIAKLMGDGAIVEFGSVVDAARFAVSVQEETAARQLEVRRERRILFRIGINVGDVVVEGDDLFGDGVNVAARLEQLCDPGGVLISGTAYDQLHGRLTLPLEFIGEQHVKNISRPVRTYRIRLDGSEPEQGYFADGFSEDLITDLSKLSGVFVIARNSSWSYKGKPTKIQQVAQELGVRYVLEGSVRRQDEQVRINAQLIDALSGHHLWAERYDGSVRDVFGLQDKVIRQIVAALAVKLTGEEQTLVAQAEAVNPQAY